MHGLDQYATLDSPLHRWEARYKIIGLFVLAFAFAFVEDLRLTPAVFAITAVLYGLSRLPVSFLLGRLKIPGFILLGIVAALPFVSGTTVLASVGPISITQEGLASAGIIATRFICIITISLLIFATDTIVNTLKALVALRLPPIMADMILLTYRYLFELRHYLQTTQTAVRMRGFRNDKLSRDKLGTLAALMGNLIVRSYEQSERIYKAMILRGYGANRVTTSELTSGRRDQLALAGLLTVSLLIVLAQLWLGGALG